MKVFLIGEYYPPLKKWLAGEGNPEGVPAVYNLYQYLGNHPSIQMYALIYTYDLAHRINLPNGSTIELRKINIRPYLLWKLWVYLIWWFRGGKQIKKYQADVLYAQGSFVSIGHRWGKKLGLLSVGRIYGTILTDLVKKRKYFALYTRNILEVIGIKKPCDLTICTKDGTQYDQVAQFFNPKSTVTLLYNGMEKTIRDQLLAYPPCRRLDPNTPIQMASIARLYPYKRHHIAIEICKYLIDAGVKVHLNIVGKGPEKSKLETLIRSLDLVEHVSLLPQSSQGEMIDWLSSQDICLMHYAGGSLGNVMWECALAGRLIATTANGDTASVIRPDNGIIYPDDEDLARKTADQIASLLGQDISNMTSRLRAEVSSLIPEWSVRFDREFELIQQAVQENNNK